MFENIPAELRERKQWVLWRLELREGAKPTKPLYVPRFGAGKASVTDPATWGTFEEALRAPLTCQEPCDPDAALWTTGFSGIGFVFTKDDPYTGIDLDDTHGDTEAYNRQIKIFQEFDSYSELSPSGTGLHIIIKGKIPGERGRRRASIELYDNERYFTMTGNVQNNKTIVERQELLELLYDQMGGPPQIYTYGEDKAQTLTDEEIIERAGNAVNGDKFRELYVGDWTKYYTSQSEADFALVDILAFYTQNRVQIARLFRASGLGQRDKAKRDDYVGYMVNKSFDRQLPPVDIDGLMIAGEALRAKLAGGGAAGGEPGSSATAAPNAVSPEYPTGATGPSTPFPPGLLGEIATFIHDVAPRQVPEIALAGAIGLMSGICGRAFNISGQGLNQYILLLAKTGDGKDAIASGTSKLMGAVINSTACAAAADFRGPGDLVSSAGLVKWLDKKPAIYSILGEIGITLQQMAMPNAGPHLKGLEKALLQIYSKSGRDQTYDPIAYSDTQKNTNTIYSPSLTILGETVPDRFYQMLDDSVISSGLLPRFLVFEYLGQRQYLTEGTEHIKPPFALVQRLADLCAQSLGLAHNHNVQNVLMNEDATTKFREFEHWTTDQINEAKTEVVRHLWNRAHLKALKLAAVCAIGINPTNPLVTIHETMWATEIVVKQTIKLIAKFETGMVGLAGGSEARQIGDVISVVKTYLKEPFAKYKKYGGTEEMHRQGVVTESHISKRVMCLTSFKNDKNGPTAALKRALKILIEADEIRELPKTQMQQRFGTGPRAFIVANPARFEVEPEG